MNCWDFEGPREDSFTPILIKEELYGKKDWFDKIKSYSILI